MSHQVYEKFFGKGAAPFRQRSPDEVCSDFFKGFKAPTEVKDPTTEMEEAFYWENEAMADPDFQAYLTHHDIKRFHYTDYLRWLSAS